MSTASSGSPPASSRRSWSSSREIGYESAEARGATNERGALTDRALAGREQGLAVMRAQLQIEQDAQNAEADAALRIQREAKTRELEVASCAEGS